MKFRRLIEDNMRNTFPENHTQNVVGKLSGKYLDQQSEILYSLLLLFLLSQVLTKYTETITSFYVIESFF